ncbi:DUF1350 family protein [Candidatus Gracilibacteria bacterium]|jgi:Protein of unknown function (DUF1350)|nr:DUF1350 family protein [Candidatus Gracilibacteria bacterium]NJM87367.1 DUF1350 family protein [Hydrococcus sp. RU_2_2]NJP19823.1 DUF1350 family protein [Hydrococcus sp. CRU_1_1]
MIWQEISGSWILIGRRPIGIVHFLGGAFVGGAPNITYRYLLEQLGKAGYAVIATPFVNTFDHGAIARSVLNRFENILERLQATNALGQSYLPIYGIGHSMGCKLHLIIGSVFPVERAGNILISFNNYPVRRAIPFIEQLELDATLNLEFTPSPEETNLLIAKHYEVRRNLLIRFTNDEIDQTSTLNPVLQERFPNMVASLSLPGNHLTPLGQNVNWNWQPGEIFTPFDAIGQWVKQGFSGDLERLNQEILRWLNPVMSF